jgi:outer membrane protein assembly factor BamA
MKSKIMWILPFTFILNASMAQSFSKDSLSKTTKITFPYQWTSVFSWGFKVNLNTTFRNYDQHYFSNRATYSVNTMSASTVFEWQFSRYLSIGVEPSYVHNIYIGIITQL